MNFLFMSNMENNDMENEQTHAPLSYDERVQLLQEGKIGHLRFVLEGDSAKDFIAWCDSHGVEPSDDAAEFYLEQTEIDAMEMQLIDDEDYGIWND